MNTQVSSSSGSLSARQVLIMMVSGVIVWFAAALLLHWLVPLGAFDGAMRVLTYLLVIPGTLPVLCGMIRLAGLSAAQVVPGFALGTGTALLCDGIAAAWFPGLYGATADHVRLAAAAVLWGAGVGIMLAFAVAHRMSRS